MFRRLNLNSISFGSRKSYRLKEKLASTLAAVALACGCAASLSACGNKNHAAKSPAPSASETTTSESQKATEDEVGDAGLNFKTIYSDALKMNISVPENAERVLYDSYFDDPGPIQVSTETYLWEKDGVYYQYSIARGFEDECPAYAQAEYDDYVKEYENGSEDIETEMIGNTILVYNSDWSANAAIKINGGCTITAGISSADRLGKPDKMHSKVIDYSYYEKNGISDDRRRQIRPVIKVVMKKTAESFNAVS